MVFRVETAIAPRGKASSLTIQMMGRLRVWHGEAEAVLPPSRKARGLLAYLALAPRPVGRGRLCELLGSVPDDPRGDLRWCLSKLRSVLDRDGMRRVLVESDRVSLDLRGCDVDVIEIEAACKAGLEALEPGRLRHVLRLCVGEFLEGITLNRSPQLDHWLTMQRQSFRTRHAELTAVLHGSLPPDSPESHLLAEQWVALSPLDARAQRALLAALARDGLPGQAERHLAAAVRLFEAEGEDATPLVLSLREARHRGDGAMRPAPAQTMASPPEPPDPRHEATRASLAVMPLLELQGDGSASQLGAGLTRDIITRLAKLRAFFVIAQGSVFALAERGVGPDAAGRTLGVDYVASGIVRRHGGRFSATMELSEVRTSRIVWTDGYEAADDEAFEMLDRIGDAIVGSIAGEIETAEKNRAVLKPPNSLNAWESYHRGLWHMHRFTKVDNLQAQHFFRRSIETDPTFARTHAGMSFTHWQNAFQEWENRGRETDLALLSAERSLMVDDHDPSAHWAMGRALWLRRDEHQAIAELQQAVGLSPNFALGHYALSFVQSQTGDAAMAIEASDRSRGLSPFDPLLFAMLASRALAHVRLGQFDEAAGWALKASLRPNSHAVIQQITALCLGLAGRASEGRAIVAGLRRSRQHCHVDEFLRTFRFTPEAEAAFRRAARVVGMDGHNLPDRT